MIRLIATDLDGTLLEPDGTLPDGTYETVEKLTRRGVLFTACSGRQYGNLRRLFAPVARHMAFICENGALCLYGGEVIGVIPIPEDMAREIIADIEAAGMNLLISGRHTTYMLDRNRRYTDDIVYRLRNTVTIVDRPDDIAEPMLKISGQIDEGLEDLAPALLKKWGSRLTATVSGRDWFDFTAANKGMGMRMLMERTGISKEEAVAFGDNFNDETMLDSVGHPFLMQHANPALRKPGIHLCKKELPVLRQLIETGTFPESGFIG